MENKILILSTEDDTITNSIIDWLHYSKRDVIRLNDTDTIKLERYEIINTKPRVILFVENRNLFIDSNEISCFWYRRGIFQFKKKAYYNFEDTEASGQFNRFVNDELEHLLFIVNKSISKKLLGSYINNKINKLQVLEHATASGLLIPKTLITTC